MIIAWVLLTIVLVGGWVWFRVIHPILLAIQEADRLKQEAEE